jgi:predicted MFS family arabinose efflux permease
MGVDALAALLVGKAYDRMGLIFLGITPLVTVPIPLLAFSPQKPVVIMSVILWGVVMGIHETTMRAAIADISPLERRGTAYGIFNIVYGAGWFVGGTAMGWLYDFSGSHMQLFVVGIEAISLVAFWAFMRGMPARPPEAD